MGALLFIVLWGIVIVGGLPRRTQETLEFRFGWWSAKVAGLISAGLEVHAGYRLVRVTLAAFSMERVSATAAAILYAISAFLLLEGLIRFLVTYRMGDLALPSLPVWAVARLIERLRSIGRGASAKA